MMRRLLPAALALVAVAGCAGGSSSPIPPKRTGDLVSATFVMHWPAVSAQRPSARRTHFISPSTKSIAIEINDDPTLTAIADNPSTGQAVTSNVTVQAPPGNDTITFALYDAAGAKGNELGQVTVTQAITAGAVNAINATIDAIVSSVELDPLPNQPTVSSTTDSTGTLTYAIAGDVPVTFVAKPKDAAGNIIVGSGAPVSFSVTATTDVLSVTPVNGQSNQFTVQVAGAAQSGASFGLIAHAGDLLGNSAQSNYSVKLSSLTYVAYQNAGAGTIAAIDESGNRVALPGTFAGITQPLGIAWDPALHRIYALDKTSSQVLAFNTDGTAALGFTPPAVSGATNLMFDYHTKQIFVTSSTNAVSVFNADGSPAQIAGTFPNTNAPVAITLDDANPAFFIFIANAGNNTYSTYYEDGTPARFGPMGRSAFSTGTLVPAAIATDTMQILIGGAVGGTDELQAFSLLGTPGATQSSGLSGVTGLTYNPYDGNFYAADRTSGAITVYDPQIAGLVRTIAAPAGLSAPVSTAFVF